MGGRHHPHHLRFLLAGCLPEVHPLSQTMADLPRAVKYVVCVQRTKTPEGKFSLSPPLTRHTDSCMPAISYIQTIYVMAMNTVTNLFLMAIPLPV